MRILDIVIIFFLFLVGYCYVLYPIVIRLLAKFFPKPSLSDESFLPTVSIILAVYNEELVLGRCMESLLALDYPSELIEIVVGSDGSSDRTNEMLSEYGSQYHFIKQFCFSEQRGKMMVLNDLVAKATGEILFFADADITLSKNTLKVQVRHFADAEIGAVGGGYQIHFDANREGLYHSEKEYASLEQNIRINEALFSSSVNVFGGNYTIRRALWRSLPDPLVHDDTYVAYNVMDRGMRVFFESESVSTEIYNRSLEDEFKRKSRSASRGYHTLSFFPKLLGFSGGKNAFLLWSHKLLRWLSPLIACIIVVLSIMGILLYNELQYKILLSGFALISIITFIGWLFERQNIRIPIIRQCSWFIIMNLAYIAGTLRFLLKTDEAIWSQGARPVLSDSSYPLKEAVHTK
jgi:biofilm PGA synthesis N-glycosyltransferase PgaC